MKTIIKAEELRQLAVVRQNRYHFIRNEMWKRIKEQIIASRRSDDCRETQHQATRGFEYTGRLVVIENKTITTVFPVGDC